MKPLTERMTKANAPKTWIKEVEAKDHDIELLEQTKDQYLNTIDLLAREKEELEAGNDVLSNAVSLLKNENERLTKYVEYSKDDKECMRNEIDVLKREIISLTQFIENELGPIGELDALLTAEFTGGTTPAYFSAQNKEEVEDE